MENAQKKFTAVHFIRSPLFWYKQKSWKFCYRSRQIEGNIFNHVVADGAFNKRDAEPLSALSKCKFDHNG